MPQLSFFPVYLQERLGLSPAAIGGIVAGAQVAGMIVALLGGAITGRLGSKWTLVCGLALSGLGALAFQVRVPGLVALLWLAGGAGLALITVGGASYLTRLTARGTLGMLAAVYVLCMTAGGALGNPLAGRIIERRGFDAFGWLQVGLIGFTAFIVISLMVYLQDRAAEPAALRTFWSGALPMTRQIRVRFLLGLRSLPTIFYGLLTVLIPLLINNLSGSKAMVAAYGTTNLIVASVAQLLAGRAAIAGAVVYRPSSLMQRLSSPAWAWRSRLERYGGCSSSACSASRRRGRSPRRCMFGWPTASPSRSMHHPLSCSTRCGASA